jgi:predicted ArsR family transcriptional regulator
MRLSFRKGGTTEKVFNYLETIENNVTFTAQELSKKLGAKLHLVRQCMYELNRKGYVQEAGKVREGNAKNYSKVFRKTGRGSEEWPEVSNTYIPPYIF